MLLKDVMDRTQLSKKAIRYYEDCGLFATQRSDNGYKDYTQENVDRLFAIKKLRDLDFSMEEIREFFDSDDKKSEVLARKLKETEEKISVFRKAKEVLEALNCGRTIQSIDSTGVKIIDTKPYMYIRNVYTLLGVFNLIAFLGIMTVCILFLPATALSMISLMPYYLVAVSLVAAFQSRRMMLKKKGIHLLERKPGEIIAEYIQNILCYLMCGSMIHETINSIPRIILEADYGMLLYAGLVGLFFFALGVTLVFASFFYDMKDFWNYVGRRFRSGKAGDRKNDKRASVEE